MGVKREAINRLYDNRMYHPRLGEYYNQSDFFNFGYWLEDTQDQKEACENLVEKLLAFIPEKTGTILDVACGMGATTRYLLNYYNASDVVGIDISMKQLERSRSNAPGSKFVLMDAPRQAFEDSLFDSVICVEAAFHFNTRRRFLEEACRVLKPGGRLVLSDILTAKVVDALTSFRTVDNYVRDLEEYRDVYLRAGFQDVEVHDATQECWKGFYHYALQQYTQLCLRHLDVYEYARLWLWTHVADITMKYYVLVAARKP